jgi:pimeloyl-ACP methyl ester carboxylesterase
MPRAQSNGIEIEYEVHGKPSARPLLLLRGLGTQMIQWHPLLCEMLAEAGHRLIVFDNRDVGLSTHFHDAGMPDLADVMKAVSEGRSPDVPYDLGDMADDVVGLMDALDLETAHIAGISMGGMIVQQVALRHPSRVRSLTSIMSSTGKPGLPGPTPEAAAVLTSRAPSERGAYIEHQLKTARVIGSPGFAFDEDAYRELAGRVFDRAYDPPGIGRQMAAIMARGSRHEALASVDRPTLVIHGDADPLVPPACGQATADAIPGARYELIPGMGHDIPEGAIPRLVAELTTHTTDAN